MAKPLVFFPVTTTVSGKELIALANATGTAKSVSVATLAAYIEGGAVNPPSLTPEPSFGSAQFSGEVVTSNISGIYTKAKGATTAMELRDFTHADNRLTRTGQSRADPLEVYDVRFDGTLSKGGGGDTEAVIAIYKDGAMVEGAWAGLTIKDQNTYCALSISCQTPISVGHHVELWIATNTGDDITIVSGVLSAKVIG
jgi:hypothetical protein